MIRVIIVAFNSAACIRSRLNSIPGAAAGRPVQIIVVDNASTDDLPSAIKRSKVEAQVLNLPSNSGYCGGNNAAIVMALGERPRPDAILILNPDVTLLLAQSLSSTPVFKPQPAQGQSPLGGPTLGKLVSDFGRYGG